MSDTHEAVIGKIKALLRLAEDSRARGSLHEAEAAAARAAEMVQRYRLDMATIEAAGMAHGEEERRRQGEKPEEALFEMSPRRVPWRGGLLSALAREHGCTTVYRRRYIREQSRNVNEEMIIGRPSDVAIVRYLFAWLTLEVTKLADAYLEERGSWLRYEPSGLRGARNAFCLGAVRGIADAMYKARKAATETHASVSGQVASGAAAMVLRGKDAELTAFVKQRYPRLVSGRGGTVSNASAYQAGHAAGGRIQTSHRAGLAGGGGRLLGGGS